MMRANRIILTCVVVATACGNKGTRDQYAATPAAPAATAVLAKAQLVSAQASSFWSAQKLIRNGDVRIQVRDVPAALRLADSIARAQESLMADSKTSQDAAGKRSAEVVIRVPSARFAAVVQSLRSLGDVQNESINTQDITKEYADLDTRLAVKEQTVARLRSLLDTKTAKLADVLEVERELGRAVEELEQMKGERRFYDQQVALSTIHVSLFERLPSQMAQITSPISDAFQSSMQVLGSSVGALIYLVVALVPWVAVTLGIVWLVKPLRRRFLTRPVSARAPAP